MSKVKEFFARFGQKYHKRELLSDPSDVVRHTLVSYTIDPDVVNHLANDTSHWVRHAAAHNPALNQDNAQRLAKDDSEDIRRGIATNKNTPNAVLRVLSHDESTQVRMRALISLRFRKKDTRYGS